MEQFHKQLALITEIKGGHVEQANSVQYDHYSLQ